MSVLQAHGLDIKMINNYNSICNISDFSIAEYYHNNSNTINAFSHNHEEYEFILPIKTIPLLIYDKANYIGEVGYAYPVNPFVNHGIEFPLNESHCIDITISKDYIDEIKKSLGYENKYFYTRFQVPLTFIDLIKKYQSQYINSKNQVILNNLKRIITTNLVEMGLESGIDNRRPEKTYRKNIRSIILYMYNNFKNKDLTIDYLANMSGYSVAYFTKSFKVYMSDTPIMHLNKLRISEAKMLMAENKYSFSQIADMVGYQNLSTFTEAFKRVTEYTPSEFKRKYIIK